MDSETHELIRGLRRQERKAQQRMLQTYGDLVFAQVASIVGCREDAEEVYQDVFVKAFRSIGTYDEHRAPLVAWLSRIACHESLNYLRCRSLPVVPIDDSDENVESMPDETLDQFFRQQDEDAVQSLEKALEFLPPDDLALVTMFYFEKQSMKDIAYIVDSNPFAIASRLSRIRKRLYKIIKSSRPHEERKP